MLAAVAGMERYISGVILFEEQLYQTGPDGKRLVQHLIDRGVLLGIKVDKGLVDLPGSPDEQFTQVMAPQKE